MTRLVAEVAVETGIAPCFLMDDMAMLLTMVDVIRVRSEDAERAGRA